MKIGDKIKITLMVNQEEVLTIQKYEVPCFNYLDHFVGKIDFDKKGEWKSIDTNLKSVPATFVHKSIADYVKKNYPDTFVSKIERDSRGYDVELSNHMDLKFDTNGNFVRFDD